MSGMAEEQTPAAGGTEAADAADRANGPGWRTGVIPGWVLGLGLVVLAVAGLGLASIGSAAGIAGVAVLEAAVVALLYSWVSSTAPR
jgi:hypothetical protein